MNSFNQFILYCLFKTNITGMFLLSIGGSITSILCLIVELLNKNFCLVNTLRLILIAIAFAFVAVFIVCFDYSSELFLQELITLKEIYSSTLPHN